jgi:enolase
MRSGSIIKSVDARQIFSGRGHPSIEAAVITENGARGAAEAVAGTSIGEHEIQFAYDGGPMFGGKGVTKAVDNVKKLIAPALIGRDAADQRSIDRIMLELDGTPNKTRLGGNATASVSGAILKAGAASLDLPLYQHIGGVNACVLPIPDVPALRGSMRYGSGQKSGGKPTYTFFCHGYPSFSQAAYAGWETASALITLLRKKFKLNSMGEAMFSFTMIDAGYVKSDTELWDLMLEAVKMTGNEGKIGIQADMAASTYYNKEKQAYTGIFSEGDKTRQEMIDFYKYVIGKYPIMILEDPLDENDYEGHAILTRELGINVMGDDLFTTNTGRLEHGIKVGACNTMLLKVNQIGTISEAFDAVQLAYTNGYGVAPCASRGEGDAIADYGVGLNSGIMSGGGIGSIVNRFLQIENELGGRARFLGRSGLKGFRNRAP